MVSASPVELIKSKIDLVQLVSGYLPGLKKSGRNWWACCPFHAEKTPSFCIWPEDDRWKCFGCGLSGDAIAFTMRMENLDFPGALKLLAEKAGVELDDRPRRPEDDARKRRLLDVNAAAGVWFQKMLLEHPSGQYARDFVEGRHLTHQTVLDFQLGYAPDSWDALRSHLSGLGYNPEEQLAAGILHESERGQPYDRFRNRLIFPIRDAGGHIVAFGGRDLGTDKKSAKFINSPQTELFDKSATLYGLDRAKNAIRDRDLVIVVEGYMDAIMAHQYGEANAVCSMGTSLTERQLEQIKRLTTNLVLALDPDTAGDAGTMRGVEVAAQVFDQELVPALAADAGQLVGQAAGIYRLVPLQAKLKADIRVMELPRGKDPDEVLYEDVAVWRQLVEQALPLLEYKFRQIVARHPLSSARDKVALVEELGGELAQIPDRIERHHYLGRLAQHLSRVAGPSSITEDDLNSAVARLLPAKRSPARRRDVPPAADDGAAEESREQPARPLAAAAKRPAPLGLDVEDFLVMRALRYLDDAHLWRQNLRTDEVAKSENREVLQFLVARMDGEFTSADLQLDARARLPEAVAGHIEFLHDLAYQEPEIPAAARQAEFERLVLKLRAQAASRSQAERATLLAQSEGARSKDVEAGAVEDLAVLHQSKSELIRRSVLAHS